MHYNNHITTSIIKVLEKDALVTVPGLGTFAKQYHSAKISEERIEPPQHLLSFNADVKTNDGILVMHIAQERGQSEMMVEELINDFVNKIFDELEAGNKVTLAGLGHLDAKKVIIETPKAAQELTEGLQEEPTDEYTLLFSPLASSSFLSENFGLEAINLHISAPIAAAVVNKAVNAAAANTNNTSKPLVGIIDESDKEMPPIVVPPPPSEREPSTLKSERTPSAVLAANRQKIDVASPPPPPVKQERKWVMWLLPLIILGLFILLLAQLSSSNMPWYKHKPFSYLFDNKTEQVADNKIVAPPTPTTTTNENKGESSTTATNNKTTATSTSDSPSNTAANPSSSAQSNGDTSTNNDNTGTNGNKGNNDDKVDQSDTPNANANNTESTSDPTVNMDVPNNFPVRVADAKAKEYAANDAPTGFYVLTGSFKTQQRASALANKIRKQSYTTYLLPTQNGWYRVGIFADSADKAKKALDMAKKRYNKDAWIQRYYASK